MLAKLSALGIAIAAAAAVPAAAQVAPQTNRDPNIGTETQERIAEGEDNSFDWGMLGLIGLLGLYGLKRRS
jgi:hypothetical protein